MESAEDNHELKIYDEYPGYCNWTSDEGRSANVTFANHQIPLKSEALTRLPTENYPPSCQILRDCC